MSARRARALAARTVAALVHHPVVDRDGQIITTAVTNLDIHDLARSSRTYGLAAYHVVTPVVAQRHLVERILSHWRSDEGQASNDFRSEALAPVSVVSSVEESIAAVGQRFEAPPVLIATSARPGARRIGYRQLVDAPFLDERPLLLLFGTGWGLAEEVLDRVDRVLAPLQGAANYNHLSVRSAAAIILDRLFGDRDQEPEEP